MLDLTKQEQLGLHTELQYKHRQQTWVHAAAMASAT